MTNDSIENFLDYVSEYDPNFRLRIAGSPSEEISELEDVSGGTLPQFYRSYLSRMGRSNGDLSLAWEANFCATDLIDAYKENVSSREIIIPPNTILIGLGGMTVEEVLLSRTSSGRDGNVWITRSQPEQWLYAEKFEYLLYQTAFTKRAASFHAAFQSCASNDYRGDLEAVFQEARKRGFRKEWFSDVNTVCATRPDSAIVASRFSDTELLIVIYAQTQSDAKLLMQHFSSMFNVS